MSFTEIFIQPQRYDEFSFYNTSGVNGSITESVNPSFKWKLREIRIHVDSSFRGAESLTAYISCGRGSAYNFVLISHAFSGSTDYFRHYSTPMMFESADQLVFKLSTASGANIVGFNIVGWAVQCQTN